MCACVCVCLGAYMCICRPIKGTKPLFIAIKAIILIIHKSIVYFVCVTTMMTIYTYDPSNRKTHVHTCIYVCLYAQVCAHMCVRVCMCVSIYIHQCRNTFIDMHMNKWIHEMTRFSFCIKNESQVNQYTH